MAYPTIGDYSAAMQNLRWNVSDEELRQGEVALLDAFSLPAPCAGGYAAVYKVHCPATRNTWAVKCFTKDIKGQRERYGEIDACLKQAQLPFMVDFQYIEPGILVGGQRYPFLKMRWVEGLKLNQFVDHSLGERPAMLRQFLPLWVRLSVLLREKRIAHADLQHGNVLLVPHGDQGQLSLKLIDYDGMFVPSLAESNSGEVGLAAYQHPQRKPKGIYSAEVDRFPHLVIYSAIRCLTLEQGLWKRYDNGENLLFCKDDFEKPGDSRLFRELWGLRHPDIRCLAGRLVLATQMPLDRVPLLHEVIREGKVLPLGPEEEAAVNGILRPKPIVVSGAGAAGPPGPRAETLLEPPDWRDSLLNTMSAMEDDGSGKRDSPDWRALLLKVAAASGTPAEAAPKEAAPTPPALHAEPIVSHPSPTLRSSFRRWLGGRWADAAWGIDIGNCTLKALRCRLDESGRRLIADAFDYIEYPRILTQPAADPAALVNDALRQFLSRNSVHGDRVAISVPGPSGLARFFKLPPVEAKKISDVIRYEARQQIPFDLDDVVWDYQRMSGGREAAGFLLESEIGLFAVKRDRVFHLLEPFREARIKVDVVQLAPMALYNYAAFDQIHDLPSMDEYDPGNPPPSLAVLSMGTDATDLVVTNGRRVWQRSIPLGGSHFTAALAKELKLTFAQAEHVKRNAASAEDPKAVFQAMRPVYNDMLAEVQRSLGYFQAIERAAKIERVIGLGGPLRLPGLRRYLAQSLGLDVARPDSFESLTASQALLESPAFQGNAPSFGVCHGLAVQGLGKSLLATNLLPRKWTLRERFAFRPPVVPAPALRGPLGPVRRFDRLLATLAGPDNTILHNFLRAVSVIALLLFVVFATRLASRSASDSTGPKASTARGPNRPSEKEITKEITVELGGGVKLEMVLIPAGEFVMGSPDADKAAQTDEKPQHRVRTTKPFYLGKNLVTQEQWEAVMGSNPSHFKGPKNPVEQVSWEDCQEFVGKLNAEVGSGKFSLPNEAQWEYACRAGSTTRYCFGDEESGLGEYAWFGENSDRMIHPVGEKKPNAWGLYDLHGNVWEWCQDWYDGGYNANSPTDDPTGPATGANRVIRGGSWLNPAGNCRSASRYHFAPGIRLIDLGFRVCRVAEPGDETPLKIQPVSPQTVEAGKRLSVSVVVEDAQRWKGKLRYVLAPNALPGARIDPQSGEFSWTPPPDQAAGKYDVTVSVQGPDGQTAQTTFAVTVTRPIPAPATSPAKEIAVDLGGSFKLEMVLIPAGEFLMGSPDSDKDANENGSERPQHRVRITRPFYLGKHLVTQEQWEAVMGSNPSSLKGPKNPVEQVSWGDCRQFVDKLNAKLGGGKFSLPTEAQWEYACRAGSTTRYCFGDEDSGLGEYAWYRENSGNQTHPVGEKKPNAWGLYDMQGNVWEWCQDWYDKGYYANSPTDDPTGPSGGSGRVARGGVWLDWARYCRSASRNPFDPAIRGNYLGFRVARAPAEAVAGAPLPEPAATLKLRPIPPQTIEAGKPLAVVVSVEDTQRWKGKLRYSLASNAPPGATIDPQSGEFSWTPPPEQAAGKQDVTVSVETPNGQTAQTTLAVTVTRPIPAPAPASSPAKEIAVDLGGGVKLEMVLIPAGEFLMGSPDSDKDADGGEKPQHRVRITRPFYLGKYLVTQEQWKAVMGGNPSHLKGPYNPVERVSWEECWQFLKKLNATMGGGKFSLPTEAQWEYACRAGSTTRYCFGDEDSRLGGYALYGANSHRKTHPVGAKSPNAWGLCDIHGNVWEWCQDWYDRGYYANSPTDDPTGPETGSDRVNRGGSCNSAAKICRSASRGWNKPGDADDDLGFRVARVPAEAVAEMPLPVSAAPLKIQPIPAQTIDAGKPLSVAVAVEDAQRWKGKLRYGLAANAPPGATIDPQSGEFSWTPPPEQAAGKQDVTVSVETPDGQTAQTTLAVTVTRPIPAPAPLPGKEIALDLGGGVKLEMVLIPAGEFLIGSPDSDKNASVGEKPQHRVRITKPFYLGKYLVTQEQWGAVTGSNPSRFKGPKNPVENVSWDDCQQFFDKLNAKSGPGGGKFQLPTEAQWEYACRAGSTTRYCFGDEESGLDEYAWYDANSDHKTHPVGEKKQNAWGLYDIHGNVFEWCQDWYDKGYDANSPTDDPTGPATGSGRVSRGGGWYDTARYCRSASRRRLTPGNRYFNLGFRVSRVPADE